MSDDELLFRRLLFMNILTMQYHPRNEINYKDEMAIVDRVLVMSNYAASSFEIYHGLREPREDTIPF
jgi:hypothetical protein